MTVSTGSKKIGRIAFRSTILAVAALTANCGSNSFTEGSGPTFTTGDAKRQPGGFNPQVHGSNLTWYLPCNDQLDDTLTTEDGYPVLFAGGGDHQVSKADVAKYPIVFSGRICELSDAQRDIMLVVDVSGSMDDNDPRRGNSCARLRAIDQVLKVASTNPNNRFAVATFSDSVEYVSSAFFANAEALYTDLAGRGDIADVVCAADGGTNYKSGLQTAANTLSGGRPDALKELFFISDGVPDRNKDGSDVASSMKAGITMTNGNPFQTTIATIMVGGARDDVLKNKIASTAPDGTLLHARADAANLAETLASLAQNGVRSGYLNYRALTSGAPGKWARVDLRPYLKNGGFMLPSMAVDPASITVGIEIKLEYWDRTGTKFSSAGRLLWD